MSIEKKLQNEAKRNRQEADVIISTNRLLEERAGEDRMILRNLGMAFTIERDTNLQGLRKETEMFEQTEGRVFTLEEIKTIACKYALKFLRSEHYRGVVDVELPAKIREFYKRRGIDSIPQSELEYKYKFYILAPQKSFNLERKPKPEPVDPIMFYKLNENNYKVIHKWGEDFTLWRRIVGWKFTSGLNYFLFWIMATIVCIYPVIWCFTTNPVFLLIPLIIGMIRGIVGSICDPPHKFDKWEKFWNREQRQYP